MFWLVLIFIIALLMWAPTVFLIILIAFIALVIWGVWIQSEKQKENQAKIKEEQEKQAKIDEEKELAKLKERQEREEARKKEEQRFNNANKTYVAGSSFKQKQIKSFVKAYCGYYGIDKYDGYTASEMKNDWIEAWEYPIITTNYIYFEDDINNIEDPNAIKVILEIDETKIHVGYIPKDKTTDVKEWVDKAVEIQAKIYGGNKKEPDYDLDDKVVLNLIESNFKIDLIFFND